MNDEKVIQSAGTNLSASQLLARSAIPFDEACVKVIELEKQLDMLLEALKECSEDLMSWGEYAGEYFQNKHDLKGTFAKYQAIIKQVESER